MGDSKKNSVDSLNEECKVNYESELKQAEARDKIPVRPKEYLVPPYAHRQRETGKYDISQGERNQPQTDIRKEISSSCEHFGSRTLTPLPRLARESAGKILDVPSRLLSKTYLEESDREPPDNVAEVFHRRQDGFVKVLKRCGKDKILINVLFSILSKITKSKGNHLIHLSSVLRQSLFIENIAVPYLLSLLGYGSDNVVTVRHAICILRYITEYSYTSVTSFLGVFTVLFDLSQEIRASDLCTPDIKAELDDFDQIRSKLNAIRLRQRKNVRTKEDQMLPPNSFRLINIPPTADELLANRAPFLRKNKDIGSYVDLEHYLDVQFRLLREDFVAPLRESIDEFKSNKQYVHGGTGKVRDMRIYSGVKIAGTTTTYEGICHVLTFDASKTRRVKWEFSKRLIYGSLLCLSCDNFQTVYFATVAQRDLSDLTVGMLDVQFMCELETVHSLAGKEFVMAESSTYFEAYKHNLTALQLIKDLPFLQYIVECRDDIKPPAYLITAKQKHYDISVLDSDFEYDKTSVEKDLSCRKEFRGQQALNVVTRKRDKTLECIDALNDCSWPSNSKLGLDESQHRALKNALTHEFSITQGPPGTGKTFIGLKVARVLLANKAVWSDGEAKQKLLIVCYTNHALDQFLCGINSFYKEGDIVRIGGRSTSEEMQKHGINTMYKHTTSDVRVASAAARETADRTEAHIAALKRQIFQLDQGIVMTPYLRKYIGRFEKPLEEGLDMKLRNRSERNLNDAPEQLDLIREWLGHGVLPSNTDIKVHFADNKLERLKSANEFKTINNGSQASNNTSIDAAPQYYEQVGCISKDIIRLSLFFYYASKEPGKVNKGLNTDSLVSVAYRDIVPMDEESKEQIHKVWKINFHQRWELYKSWVEELKHDLIEKLREYEDNFLECCKNIKRTARDKQIEALKQADVIGMTTTGAAKHFEVLQTIKPKIVIVEEAAEVLEGHIITSLSDECEHLILIGDHKQLKPSPTVYQLAKKYKLDLSLFERMINNKVNHEKLEIQHRMRPEIANIIRLIYPYLKDHEIVLNKPDVRGVSKNVYFVKHNHLEEEEEDTLSHLNTHEAEFVVGLCQYLLKQEYKPSQITVLTTYRAQMFYLQKLMSKDSVFARVNITVVDNYQGEENEIILLSLVRSNSSKKVGFLKAENRINVALSRARNGLYVIGNFESFADVSDTWAKIVQLLQKEDQIGPAIPLFCRNHSDTKLCAQTMNDFENAPEGGCTLNCDARLDCGHVCELKCHVYDTDHRAYMCKKQCVRVCKNGHPCFKKCFENCGDCQVPVVKTIPECKHEQTMPCFQSPLDWDCIASCDKTCDNGHQCQKRCYEDCGNCIYDVLKVIPACGHEQKIPCFADPLEWGCLAKCEKMCRNEHPCMRLCYEDCNFCKVEMVKSLPHCSHKHTMLCYMDETTWKCHEDCESICKNNHKCNKMCYEDCGNCDVIFQRKMTKCGHNQLIPCFMDESEWKCNAYCEKSCKNNHKYKKLCSDDCNCTTETTKKMPDCGHFQNIPCSVEPSHWVCKAPCEGKLKCGHECPSLCSDTTNHNLRCIRNMSKKLSTSFRWSLQQTYKDACRKNCEFVLDCGHKCPLKCYEPHENTCHETITIVLDKCGHSNEIECYLKNQTNDCFKPCEFILECGHKCKRKCYEPHTTTCEELVLKEMNCGHCRTVQCHEDVESVLCVKPCEFKLDCGHQCPRRCSDSHTHLCTEEIEKSLPCCQRLLRMQYRDDIEKVKCPFPCQEKLECGHSCTNKCSDSHTSVCKVEVDKALPCGHVQNLHCGVNVDTIKCYRHCKTVLPCGHACKNRCIEPHTSECQEIINYECNYGHKVTAPCYKIYTKLGTECHYRCRQKIACGHICSGSCFECRGGILHKACSVCPLPDLKTHSSSLKTREGIQCLAKCQNRCNHKICEKLCFEPCAENGKPQWPCKEMCNAECEHFNCPKRLFEQQKNEFCSDTYEMIASIAENMNKPRNIKQNAEVQTSHKSCGALVDAILVEAALKQHVKGSHRRIKELNAATYVKIAGKLHEFEEEVKLKSQFYAKHMKLQERILSLESMIESMDHTVDLYKIYKYRLEYNRENFKNWFHFQKQGYKDLEKEIERLERMARTILSK